MRRAHIDALVFGFTVGLFVGLCIVWLSRDGLDAVPRVCGVLAAWLVIVALGLAGFPPRPKGLDLPKAKILGDQKRRRP